MRNLALATASVIALTAGAASAATMSATSGPFNALTDLTSSTFSFTGNTGLTFPGFNTSLGTLTAVTLQIEGNYSTTLRVSNPETGDGTISSVVVSDGEGGFITAPLILATFTGEAPSGTPLVELDSELQVGNSGFISETVPGGGSTDIPLVGTGSDTVNSSTASVLSAFSSGPVTYSFDGISELIASLNPASMSTSTVGTSVDITGTVVFDYEYEVDTPPIPVPAALPLMASALGVFGVMRYRKRK